MSKQSSDLPLSTRQIFLPQDKNRPRGKAPITASDDLSPPGKTDDPEAEQFSREMSKEIALGLSLQYEFDSDVVNEIIYTRNEARQLAFDTEEERATRDQSKDPHPPLTTSPSRLTAEGQAIVQQALQLLEELHRPGQALSSPEDTRNLLQLTYAHVEREIFGALFLDNQHRLIAREEIFYGTINQLSVHTREIVKCALVLNAAAVVLYHNHPSGEPEPSRWDQATILRQKEALMLVHVRVLDLFVIGEKGVLSFAELGRI